jgi:cold shock CspA family protein
MPFIDQQQLLADAKSSNLTKGVFLQTVVKKWFRDKDCGFLDNGNGSDIMVRKADLVGCQFLKVGATVEFECHQDKQGLIAKKVRLSKHKNMNNHNNGNKSTKEFRFGVMT